AFNRSGLKLEYSSGFHPHPKLRFSPPLAVGIESVCEILDFDLKGDRYTGSEVMDTLGRQLPEGLKPLDLQEISLNEPSVSGIIGSIEYKISADGSITGEDFVRGMERFESVSELLVVRAHKGKVKTRNLKEWIEILNVIDQALVMRVRSTNSGSLNPLDAVAVLLDRERNEVASLEILKTSVTIEPLMREND
ncbi:MAG: TIGR03936 family radical SAM-associated protein, partial [Pseudomonadota bacterium]